MQRAFVYCRVSDPRQSKENDPAQSLKFQEADGRAYCAQKQYEVVDVMSEVVSTLSDRTTILDTLERMKAERIDVLVCWKYDRLRRDQTFDAYLWYRVVDELDARIESATEPAFEDTPRLCPYSAVKVGGWSW